MKLEANCDGESHQDWETLSPFEKLPPELFAKVVDLVPECVFNIRKVSRVTKYRVDQYASETCAFYLADELSMHRAKTGEICGLHIIVPRKLSSLFQLRLQLRGGRDDIRANFMGHHAAVAPKLLMYSMKLTPVAHRCTLDILLDAIERRTRKMSIHCLDDLRYIRDLLSGVQIRKLIFSSRFIDQNHIRDLFAIVKAHKVDHLTLRISGFQGIDGATFLVDLAAQVSSLQLATGRENFSGLDDVKWASTIIDMFAAGKLSKLLIESAYFPGNLPVHDANLLREKLPLVGKRIWFKMSCNAFKDGLNYDVNGVQVQADKSNKFGCALRIKHISRINEKFVQ